MPGDILDDMIKESWLYKKWVQEAIAEGFQQGFEEGSERGAQQMFVCAVQSLFSSLTSLAQERSALLKKPELLQPLLTQIIQAQNEEEARRYLLAANNGQTDK